MASLLMASVPAFFLESRNILEVPTDLWAHAPILFELKRDSDPVKRIITVTKWFLSAWHLRPKGCVYPGFPVCGEVFRASWQHLEGSASELVSACCKDNTNVTLVQNLNEKLRLHITMNPSIKLNWNSATLYLACEGRLELLDRVDENYRFNMPDLVMKGIFVGDLRMEVVGKCKITCEKTSLESHIDFLSCRPFCGSAMNRVRGSICQPGGDSMYRIEGIFSSKIYITRSRDGSQSVLFDVEKEPVSRKLVKPMREQEKHESGRIWQSVNQALKRHDYGTAAVERLRVESEVINPPPPLFQLRDDKQWVYVGEKLEKAESTQYPPISFERDEDDMELELSAPGSPVE